MPGSVGFSCLIGWHRLCSLEKSCRPYYPNCGKRTLLSSSFKIIHVFSHAPPLIIKGEQNPNAPSICMCDQQLSLQRLYCSAVVNSGQIYVHIYIFYFFCCFSFFFKPKVTQPAHFLPRETSLLRSDWRITSDCCCTLVVFCCTVFA